MLVPFHWVDAFTDTVFGGNPAAVCEFAAWPEDALLQRMAAQHGLSETAFLVRTGPARYALRWFTPTVEVDLCGHATLAAAHVLLNEQRLADEEITFDSRSGPLTVRRAADGRIELDFPVTPPVACDDGGALAHAITLAIGRPVRWAGQTKFDAFALIDTADQVRTLRPELGRVAALGGRGLIVTAPGEGVGCDFVSRFFAPQAGVPEDPVTGSAHCALTPFWADRLGRKVLRAQQVSARGGAVGCTLAESRVRLSGYGATYLRGNIDLAGASNLRPKA